MPLPLSAPRCPRSFMAQRLHQARVISLLEPYLDHSAAPVRQRAAQHLLVATYRPPDRPASPSRLQRY